MKDKILEYFLKYVKIDTMSSEETETTPSTEKQYNLAEVLKRDLIDLGLENVEILPHCFVRGILKSNCNSTKKIGFIAHMDTIPGFSGTNVKPNVIKNYSGEDIKLNGIELTKTQFPFLSDLVGKTLITTDGTTVLGADDKAGIADIMGMLYYFKENPNAPHVNIHIEFTPDEEIGRGVLSFDVKDFDCDYAYTVDGGKPNEINYENFNAASAIVEFNGLDIHPGSAKNQMKNASLIAMEFNSLLPVQERPEYTDNYDGFNHLCETSGCVGNAKLEYIIRNHDRALLERQKNDFINAQQFINNKYGENTCILNIKDSYRNMAELILENPECLNRAKARMERLGLVPYESPIRGGTDGARLTFMGLPTPNLGTGGYNCHGPYELACLEEMEQVSKVLIEIAKEN